MILPPEDSAPGPSPPAPPSAALVVDDEPTTRLMVRAVLEQLGYAVTEAEDGKQALELFAEQTPLLVVMDVRMPELDGLQCCRAIRAQACGRDVPIVLVTGVDDTASIEEAYQVGATDFVHKPINWILFRHRIPFIVRASRAFQDLRQSQARLLQAQRIAKLGYWEWRCDRDEIEISADLALLLGLQELPRILTESQFREALPEPIRTELWPILSRAVQERSAYTLDFRIATAEGERIIHGEGETVGDTGGSAVLMRSIMQDMTQQFRAQEEIHRLAHYDVLTGLPNRTLFTEQLRLALARASRQQVAIGVMCVGLRRIDQLREALGPVFADSVIREVALLIRDSLRKMDLVGASHLEMARFGTHEFVLFVDQLSCCPGPGSSDLPRIAQRVLDVLAEPFMVGTQPVQLGCAIGIVCYPDDGGDPETLFTHAHAAMNAAQKLGERVYAYHTPEIQRSVMERFNLESSLLLAIKQGGLDVHFQPQLDLNRLVVLGFEALARWQHPDLGRIPPDRFVPIAEESGMIADLGEQVLRNALLELRSWPACGHGRPPQLSVNVSARQIWGRDFVAVVRGILAETGVDASLLVLVLTESVLMKDSDDNIRILHELKDLGLKLAIDDFGTGFSSMRYFRRLPVDELKIDRGFIFNLQQRGRELAIVRSVIALGHNLGLKVVAEGVETAEQLQILRDEGCDWGQGYFIGRPLPGPEARGFCCALPPQLASP